MTEANTYLKIDSDEEKVVTKVLLFGDNAYLWSSENDYEFDIEQRIPITEENLKVIDDLIKDYGIDWESDRVIGTIQGYRNGTARTSDFINALKRFGAKVADRVGYRLVRGTEKVSDRTRDNDGGEQHSSDD